MQKKQVIEMFSDLWMMHRDHSDNEINNLIQILKKPSDHRSSADLLELSLWIKNVKFFKEYGIIGRDLLDVCEFLTYDQ